MTGDDNDIKQRLIAGLPAWFGDDHSTLDTILTGESALWQYIYSLYSYAANQTRISTATDSMLDIIATDFFGTSLQRIINESDTSYRARIKASLFQSAGTRSAMFSAIKRATGYDPVIYEPLNPSDICGGYGYNTGMGYGVHGKYASILYPAQCFIIVYRASTNEGNAGYMTPAGDYGSNSRMHYQPVTALSASDATICSIIDKVKPAGTIVWVSLQTPS